MDYSRQESAFGEREKAKMRLGSLRDVIIMFMHQDPKFENNESNWKAADSLRNELVAEINRIDTDPDYAPAQSTLTGYEERWRILKQLASIGVYEPGADNKTSEES